MGVIRSWRAQPVERSVASRLPAGVERGDESPERAHRDHQVDAPGHRPVDDLARAALPQEQHVEDDRKAHRDGEELPTAQQADQLEAGEGEAARSRRHGLALGARCAR